MINLVEFVEFCDLHHNDLKAEAERERLAALLRTPRASRASTLRRVLAMQCNRLANWLDDPSRYLQRVETGREDWASPWASV